MEMMSLAGIWAKKRWRRVIEGTLLCSTKKTHILYEYVCRLLIIVYNLLTS